MNLKGEKALKVRIPVKLKREAMAEINRLADRVKQAKQFGKISSFFYSSVTADYLAAALDAL